MPAPKKNVAFSFVLPLVDSANRPAFKANPTLAAGDFKHSGDGSALTNLGTLPAADPASSRLIKITLSQDEMNYDRVTIQCVDAAGSEWDEVIVCINTTAQTVDDLAAQASVDAILLDTAEIGTAGAGLAAIPWNAAWGAEVQLSAADALAAYDGPTHAELVGEINDVQSDIAALNDLDAAGVRAAVGLANANLDAQLAALAAYVDTEVAAILAAVDNEVAAIKAKTDNLPASPAATADIPTATENADALLKRDIDQVEAVAAVHSLASAVLKLVSRFKAASGETFRTDGATVHMTQAVTQGSITPITELGVGQ